MMTNDESQISLQSVWATGHAAAVTRANRAGVEVHADKFSKTRSYSEIAGQSFAVFGPTRTGMSVGPVLPQMLDLADKPKR